MYITLHDGVVVRLDEDADLITLCSKPGTSARCSRCLSGCPSSSQRRRERREV